MAGSPKISRKLKSVRKKLGLTQVRAASLFGIPKGTLQSWEAGHRAPSRLAEGTLYQILNAALAQLPAGKRRRTQPIGGLSRRLKTARAKLGFSPLQAATAWRIPVGTLLNWETNHRTPRGLKLRAINQLLDGILTHTPRR
jgi:DNA-binding transcriptional regulator YiaG